MVIEYLGLIVKEGQLSMDPVKLKGITEWPTPAMVKQLWAFLGFEKFYQQFIQKFSEIAMPLDSLLNNIPFEWTLECQEAFLTLKKRFTEEPVLMMPDQTQPFQIESNASKYASGAVLTQMNSNGDRHPVAFMSKTFIDTEQQYKIYDQKLLGIIHALEEW